MFIFYQKLKAKHFANARRHLEPKEFWSPWWLLKMSTMNINNMGLAWNPMKKAISRKAQSCISNSDNRRESRLLFFYKHKHKVTRSIFLFISNTKNTSKNEFTQFQYFILK